MLKKIIFTLLLLTDLLTSCESLKSQSRSEQKETKMVTLGQMEIELAELYKKVEKEIKVNYGVDDPVEIEKIMQMLIDEANMSAPFIVENKNGIPKISYLKYKDYKKYRADHLIDTLGVFTMHLDSVEQNNHYLDSDSLKPLIKQLIPHAH